MKGTERGHFCGQTELLALIALVAIWIAMSVPIYAHLRHAHTVAYSIITGFGIPLVIYAVIPFLLSLPISLAVKICWRRDERFTELTIEYWAGISVGLLTLSFAAGICLFLWDSIIKPSLRYFHLF